MRDWAIVTAAAILALAYVFGDRFELHGSDHRGIAALKVDRLTGTVTFCVPEGGQDNMRVACHGGDG